MNIRSIAKCGLGGAAAAGTLLTAAVCGSGVIAMNNVIVRRGESEPRNRPVEATVLALAWGLAGGLAASAMYFAGEKFADTAIDLVLRAAGKVS